LLRPKNLRFSSRTNLIKTRCASLPKKIEMYTKRLVNKKIEHFSTNEIFEII